LTKRWIGLSGFSRNPLIKLRKRGELSPVTQPASEGSRTCSPTSPIWRLLDACSCPVGENIERTSLSTSPNRRYHCETLFAIPTNSEGEILGTTRRPSCDAAWIKAP
jgi:hypothetical protein